MWLLSGAVVFVLVFVILFGQFGTHLSGVWDGAYGGLRYWAHEHSLHRGGEDWFAYLILLVAYELPLLVLGIDRRRLVDPPAPRARHGR